MSELILLCSYFMLFFYFNFHTLYCTNILLFCHVNLCQLIFIICKSALNSALNVYKELKYNETNICNNVVLTVFLLCTLS